MKHFLVYLHLPIILHSRMQSINTDRNDISKQTKDQIKFQRCTSKALPR